MEHAVPPFIKLAMVKGAIITRRTWNGIKAGRAFKLLENARRGFLSDAVEDFSWRQANVGCVVCGSVNTATARWSEHSPTESFDLHAGGETGPAKVLDAFICYTCRIKYLPRIKIYAQWDVSSLGRDEQVNCTCQWDGSVLLHCEFCWARIASGMLVRVEEAEGWQVTVAAAPVIPLRPILTYPMGTCYTEDNLRIRHISFSNWPAWDGPPSPGMVIENSTPAPTMVSLAARGGNLSPLLPSGVRRPWEQIISYVLAREDVPLTDLSDVPREVGMEENCMFRYTTVLDSTPKKLEYKAKIAWMKLCPAVDFVEYDSTDGCWVKIVISMAMIPYEGIYSMGLQLSTLYGDGIRRGWQGDHHSDLFTLCTVASARLDDPKLDDDMTETHAAAQREDSDSDDEDPVEPEKNDPEYFPKESAASCPFPNCDGRGNVVPYRKSHRSLWGCPNYHARSPERHCDDNRMVVKTPGAKRLSPRDKAFRRRAVIKLTPKKDKGTLIPSVVFKIESDEDENAKETHDIKAELSRLWNRPTVINDAVPPPSSFIAEPQPSTSSDNSLPSTSRQ